MGADILALVTAGSITGGLVSLAMVGAAWRNRNNPAAPAFSLLMASVSGWCFFAAAFVLAGEADTAYLLTRLSRLSAAHVAPLLLVFVLSYAGYTRWLAPKWLTAFWIVPVVYVLFSLTGTWHRFASGPEDVEMVTAGGITAPVVHTQLVRDVHLAVAYLLVLASYAVLVHFYRRSRTTHRRQIILIGLGAFVPFVANVAFTSGTTIHPGIDLTPVTFTLTGVVMGWALFRYDFLEAAPVTTEVLVEQLPDPVLVVDEDDCVVDHNPAASAVFGEDGMTGSHVAVAAPGLIEHIEAKNIYSFPEPHAVDSGSVRYYDPNVTTLDDQHGTVHGRLVVLRDVTGQQRRQDRLEALQTATQQFITATTKDQIAQLSVDFVEQALDRHAAGVFLIDDDGTLRPVALTEKVREYYDESDLFLDEDTTAYEVFETQRSHVEEIDDDSPFRRYAFYPLGENGILGIGSRNEEPFASDDEQFATILARATQVALSQVDRERELRRSREAVERRSEQIEFFNGILRHTLRNALLVIQGRADHLSHQVDDGGQCHLDVIDQWCNDLAALNDEIRAINDTVTATESERFEVVDLTHLLEDGVRTVEDDYPNLEISLDVANDVQIYANELAGRVLTSVVLNAVSHNDTDEPRVEITVQRASDRVQVYVADNGPGMSDEMKETVLERDVATSQTSHGFGLYFVSVMMNLYGGTVSFEDNDPRGTVACLEFQAAD